MPPVRAAFRFSFFLEICTHKVSRMTMPCQQQEEQLLPDLGLASRPRLALRPIIKAQVDSHQRADEDADHHEHHSTCVAPWWLLEVCALYSALQFQPLMCPKQSQLVLTQPLRSM